MNSNNTVSATSKRAIAGLMTLAVVFTASACNDNTALLTGVDTNRVYKQIERLGNPLVSEVFFPKRDHGLHNNKSPPRSVRFSPLTSCSSTPIALPSRAMSAGSRGPSSRAPATVDGC